jgi:predicted metalloenzyme YecM
MSERSNSPKDIDYDYIKNIFPEFMADVLANLEKVGIDISNREIDHLAFRASSIEQYESLKKALKNQGTQLAEILVRNRPICVFELNKPLEHNSFPISCLEIMAPAKEDKTFERGLEHIEVIIDNESLLSFMQRYPHVNFNTTALNDPKNPELMLFFENDANVKFRSSPLSTLFEQQQKTNN